MTDNTLLPKKARAVSSRCRTKIQHVTNFITGYNFRIKDERINTPTQILQNNTDQYSSFLDSRYTIQTKIIMDKKISDKKVNDSFHSSNNLPQRLTISPSYLILLQGMICKKVHSRNYLEVSAKILVLIKINIILKLVLF
jgi:hypothetical protein